MPPTFDELAGILLQEEERIKFFELDSNGSDLALIARGKRSFQGRPWDRNRGRFQAKQKGMALPVIMRSSTYKDIKATFPFPSFLTYKLGSFLLFTNPF